MQRHWLTRRGTTPGRFRYYTAEGQRVTGERARAIDALAIPPAWRDVHIAPSDRSAIQAWGYDARGRKQYRYHPRAMQKGAMRKYYRLAALGRDLAVIRQRVNADFRRPGLDRDKVIAGVVRLLWEGFFRIGSERYAQENHTFGITTLNKSHVSVEGDAVSFSYVGKRSIRHKRMVVSTRLARFVTALQKIPGRRLFRYRTEDGAWRNVDARQVNDYLRRTVGFPYSAKDFRTWGGTLRAATVLAELGPAASEREAQKNVVTAVRLVAAELGNTPAICRASYVHPVLIEAYVRQGATIRWNRIVPPPAPRPGDKRGPLAPEERALVAFLNRHFPERSRSGRSASR